MRALLILALLPLAACTWRGYDRVLEVHAEVLASMAGKMCALTAGAPPPSERMGEFSYPVRRARDFERQYAGRSGQASYRAFSALASSYAALVERFDKARASREAWQTAAETICGESRGIEEAAAELREVLAAEG